MVQMPAMSQQKKESYHIARWLDVQLTETVSTPPRHDTMVKVLGVRSSTHVESAENRVSSLLLQIRQEGERSREGQVEVSGYLLHNEQLHVDEERPVTATTDPVQLVSVAA